MKIFLSKFTLLIFTIVTLSSCSLAPERKITLRELQRTKNISYYVIKDDMDGIVEVLNRDGEVVVRSEFLNNPVYLKIFATSEGIEIRHFDRNEFSAPE